MVVGVTITLDDLLELAREFAPVRARWDVLLHAAENWGPAHEIGHALISTRSQRRRLDYGLCSVRSTLSARYTAELAAMRISRALLHAAGRPDLFECEKRATPGLAEMQPWRPASWRLVLRRGLWPLPRTRVGLERLLERKLGR